MNKRMLTTIIVGVLCFSVLPMLAQMTMVYAAPSVSIAPTLVTMDVGQSQMFTATAWGGYYPYTYYWGYGTTLLQALTRAAQNGPTYSTTWTFTPSATGSYIVLVLVKDSVNATQYATASVTVNSAPSVSISPYSATMHVGNHLVFTATPSGGTTPYTYYWGSGTTLLKATQNAAQNGPTYSTTWTFTPSATGYYYVVVVLQDSVGVQSPSVATVTVNP